MLLLVPGSNYVVMFIGWEGVGLCSYLLIGFWFKNKEFASAGKKAFVMNRIGDLSFLIAVFLIFNTFGTLEFVGVFSQAAGMAMGDTTRSEEHTSELQSLMRISYAVFCLKKKKHSHINTDIHKYTTD